MRNARKNERGITLITVVITMLVLLILAGVVFSSLEGNDGLLSRTKNAGNEFNKSAFKEQIELDLADIMLEYYMDGRYGIDITSDEFKEKLEEKGYVNITENGDGSITVKKDGGKAVINPDLSVEIEGLPTGEKPIIPIVELEGIVIVLSEENWTNQDITVTITGWPETANIKEYKIGEQDWEDYTGSFVITENTDIYIRVAQFEGYYSESPVSITIANIDKTVPEIGTITENQDSTEANITIQATGIQDQGGSGIASTKWYVKVPGGNYDSGTNATITNGNTNYTYTMSQVGEYTFKLEVVDVAGNITNKETKINLLHVHEYGYVSNGATNHSYKCAGCGDVQSTANHNLSTITTVSATCTSTGTSKTTCSICSYNTTGTISSLGHSYSVPSSCSTSYYCTRSGCGTFIGTTSGHSYGGWTTTTSATCTSSGSRYQECSKCSNRNTEGISSLGHSYSVPSSCSTSYYCTRSGCGTFIGTTSGHSYGGWTTTLSATCTSSGSRYQTCSRCLNKNTETILSLGHNYGASKCGIKKCNSCGTQTGTLSHVDGGTRVTESCPVTTCSNMTRGRCECGYICICTACGGIHYH